MMIGRLKTIFSRRDEKPAADPEGALRLAVTALLVEAGRVDESFDADERALVTRLVGEEFDLAAADAATLVRDAEAAVGSGVNVHRFTKLAKALPPDSRLRLIENMWKVVLSDDRRDPYEDALIRKVCGLIYIDDTESAAARRRAAAARAPDGQR
jgi:uncharacterized tellurite resistance protein B-like protein